MSRSAVTTHLGLALLALGVLVLASATLGFAGATADRMTTANVVDDESAYVGVEFQGEGENGTEFEQSPELNITDNGSEEFLLANVSNNFDVTLNDVSAEIKGGKLESKLIFSDPAVKITGTPDELASGATGQIYAECNDNTKDRYTVSISATSEDAAVRSVEIEREFKITCSKEYMVES